MFLTSNQSKSLLEQSTSCRPESHVHFPVLVSQSPALLQSAGQVNSEKNELPKVNLSTYDYVTDHTLPEQSNP